MAITLETGSVEALNDACHSAWGIAVNKTSTTSARAAISQTVSIDNPAIESDRSKGSTLGKH